MAALLFAPATLPALGVDGTLEPLGYWRFYIAGTTTLADVFTTEDLDVELSNPVRANSAGVFPPIWINGEDSIRAQALDSDANLIPGRDFDPYNVADTGLADGSVTAAKLHADAITDKLGYTPLNKAGDTATDLDLVHASPNAASAGYMGAPVNQQDGDYTVLATDLGKLIRQDSASAKTKTIAANLFGAGGYIGFRNVGAGAMNIVVSGGSLKILGSGSAPTGQVAQHGEVWLRHDTETVYYISGVGYT